MLMRVYDDVLNCIAYYKPIHDHECVQ